MKWHGLAGKDNITTMSSETCVTTQLATVQNGRELYWINPENPSHYFIHYVDRGLRYRNEHSKQNINKVNVNAWQRNRPNFCAFRAHYIFRVVKKIIKPLVTSKPPATITFQQDDTIMLQNDGTYHVAWWKDRQSRESWGGIAYSPRNCALFDWLPDTPEQRVKPQQIPSPTHVKLAWNGFTPSAIELACSELEASKFLQCQISADSVAWEDWGRALPWLRCISILPSPHWRSPQQSLPDCGQVGLWIYVNSLVGAWSRVSHCILIRLTKRLY